MSQLPIEKWAKYTKFAENLSNKFDDACRSVMADNRSDPKTRQRMGLDTEDVDSAKADDPRRIHRDLLQGVGRLGRLEGKTEGKKVSQSLCGDELPSWLDLLLWVASPFSPLWWVVVAMQ